MDAEISDTRSIGTIIIGFGIVAWIVSAFMLWSIACREWNRPYCLDPVEPFHTISAILAGVGLLMIVVGWLLTRDKIAWRSISSL